MAPLNSEVDKLNEEILEMFDEEEQIYDRCLVDNDLTGLI
jgi:hypothetical protein